MNIYIGNLSPDVSDQELEDLFALHGKVRTTKIVRDMFTQQSKGMGFIEMMNNTEATTAIKELNLHDLKGKKIIVNEARPQRNDRRGGKRR
ncbi:MAG: RNA-binding protein [Melioribacteraceae bacterium]|nr:RNA-binding protein [Melioribacteraceae bacterium]